MPFFLVKLRREVEFESVYEADFQSEAEGLAQVEANHYGEIQNEQIITAVVEQAAVYD